MVGRDTVTFRFRLDAKEMQRLIRALEQDAKRFGATMSQVKGQSDNLSQGLGNTGKQAASAAINFQTATQGMLNLSTATVQTVTSISNLDRAANRLAQSKIAVARAEDLLAAKTLRLRELEEKGLGHTTKAINLTNELATARADLAVKNDKARIEEGALLDVQMLFVTNIANVMISSIQTIKTLRDLQALSTIKATIAEKALNSTFITSTIVSRTAAANFKGMTFAIKGLTFSVRGLMLALGPVALLITGVTVAMQAYEENWGGFRDAVQTALPFLDDSNDKLKESEDILNNDRKAMEGYVSAIDSMNSSMKKLEPQHKLYLEMHRDAFLAMDKNSKLAAYYSSQLAGLRTGQQGFSTPSLGGGLPTGGGIAGTAITTGGGVPGPVSAGGGVAATPTVASNLVDLADPTGTNEQKFIFTQLSKDDKMNVLLTKATSAMAAEDFETANEMFAEFEKVKAKPVMEADPVKRWQEMQKQHGDKTATFFGGRLDLKQQPRRMVTDKIQEFRFGIDIASREGIDPDSTRGIVLNKTGRDIGPIANFVDVNEGIRLANLETTLSQFTKATPGMIGGVSGGRTDLLLAAIESQIAPGRKTEKGLDILAKMNKLSGGLVAPGMEFGTGFFKSTGATAAFQIPEFGISAERRKELDIKDRNTNLLRFGGRLRDGFSIWDEDAVIGGYSSRKAFSDASKRKFYSGVDEATRMLQFFGGGIRSSAIRGRSSRQMEYRRVLNRGTSIKEALTLAGLGYKTINTRLGSRPDRHRIDRFRQEMNEVISFNQNQLAKAETINILQQDFGLTGFTGTTMSLPSLQERLAAEDERMKLIGLTRTEAFQIVDTEGRGREEIDDRIRFKDRMNSMSTGVSVL